MTHKNHLLESQPVIPTVARSVVSVDQINKLFYAPTTRSSFQSPNISPSKSFSDVHKAAQRVPVNTRRRAPFWSRDMSHYNQCFIALPIEGSNINKELARTFQPDVSSSGSSPQRAQSCSKSMYRTRYSEDFETNVVPGKDYRLPPFQPKVQKHVRDNDRLLYNQSVTHESFGALSNSLSKSSASPPIPKAEKTVYKLSSSTRYFEDFPTSQPHTISDQTIPLRPSPVSKTNRVFGATIPYPIRQYIYENGTESLKEANVDDVLSSNTPSSNYCITTTSSNPYMAEFLNM